MSSSTMLSRQDLLSAKATCVNVGWVPPALLATIPLSPGVLQPSRPRALQRQWSKIASPESNRQSLRSRSA
jgi:hypothetical protein